MQEVIFAKQGEIETFNIDEMRVALNPQAALEMRAFLIPKNEYQGLDGKIHSNGVALALVRVGANTTPIIESFMQQIVKEKGFMDASDLKSRLNENDGQIPLGDVQIIMLERTGYETRVHTLTRNISFLTQLRTITHGKTICYEQVLGFGHEAGLWRLRSNEQGIVKTTLLVGGPNAADILTGGSATSDRLEHQEFQAAADATNPSWTVQDSFGELKMPPDNPPLMYSVAYTDGTDNEIIDPKTQKPLKAVEQIVAAAHARITSAGIKEAPAIIAIR